MCIAPHIHKLYVCSCRHTELWKKEFYKGIDLFITHSSSPRTRALWTGGLSDQLALSYASVPAPMYRDLGMSLQLICGMHMLLHISYCCVRVYT